jgi:thioredoxin-related protein
MVRLSVGDQIGAQLAQSYGVRGVPSLMLFDGAGEIGLRQVGHVDPDDVLAYIDSH